jgi:hypothetical protein
MAGLCLLLLCLLLLCLLILVILQLLLGGHIGTTKSDLAGRQRHFL